MLPKVFDLFVQTMESDRAGGGLGIGLTLVKRLVELHGGTVSASSQGQGKGTEFVVRLPAEAAEQVVVPTLATGSLPESGPAARLAKDSLHILVVEDNADIRETLKDLLELFGHTVDLAEDGLRGVEKAISGDPGVVLVDIGMPGVDGYTVARSIRERRPDHPPRLIAITGYGQPEDRRRAIEAGFDAHLVKPVDPTTLERLLAEQP
jgi:CheY-like chemotaxis protein